jgi:hypothetical protein
VIRARRPLNECSSGTTEWNQGLRFMLAQTVVSSKRLRQAVVLMIQPAPLRQGMAAVGHQSTLAILK